MSFWLARNLSENNPLYPPFLRGNQKDSRCASLAGMTTYVVLLMISIASKMFYNTL
jgi:hypothetical protein